MHTLDKPFVCPVGGCSRPFSVFSNMKRHMTVHPSVDFRGISVRDLDNMEWLAHPTDVSPPGLRFVSSGQLIGTGMLPGMPLINSTSRRQKKADSDKAVVKREQPLRWTRSAGRQDEEGAMDEMSDDGGWGPGGSDVSRRILAASSAVDGLTQSSFSLAG